MRRTLDEPDHIRRGVRTPVTWWTAIVLLTGAFQVYRGAPLDGAFFLAAGTALTVDRLGLLPASETRPAVPGGLVMAGSASVVVVAALTTRYGPPDVVGVAAVGLAVLRIGWPDPAPAAAHRSAPGAGRRVPADAPTAGPVRNAAIAWSAVGVAGCLWELTEYVLGRPSAAASHDHPALSDLVDPLLHGGAGRGLCTAAWLLGLWFLLRRARPS